MCIEVREALLQAGSAISRLPPFLEPNTRPRKGLRGHSSVSSLPSIPLSLGRTREASCFPENLERGLGTALSSHQEPPVKTYFLFLCLPATADTLTAPSAVLFPVLPLSPRMENGSTSEVTPQTLMPEFWLYNLLAGELGKLLKLH